MLLAAHAALYLTVVLWVLRPPEALAFLAVHQAVFSLYLGCNASGGRLTGFVLGGLNHQIEDHLSPPMPRPNLAGVQDRVRSFCLEKDLS